MDYETKMLEREQEGEEKGRKEGLITGVHYLISVLRDYGETNQGILQRLKQKYGNDFSDDQLKEFLKQNQTFIKHKLRQTPYEYLPQFQCF